MQTRMISCVAALLASLLCHAARAQAPDITGAWSWQSPNMGGTDFNTLLFNGDGSFVRTSKLATGAVLRSWGHYEASQAGPNRVFLQSRTEGWMPTQICVVAPGVGRNCRPAPGPVELNFPVTFTSPTTIATNDGTTLQRDQVGALLRAPAQQTFTIYMPAPATPQMAQPVMPQLHPYTTPNGPGNQMANANHAQNRAWLDQNMRGCWIDQYGRRWGCQQ